jgi:hypothetical protein
MISGLPENMQRIVNELLRRGICCQQIPKTCIIDASTSSRRHFLSQYTLPIIPQIYAKLLDNKKNFKDMLVYQGVPFVLPYQCFKSHELDAALHYVQQTLQFPVACKPQHGMASQRVSLGIEDKKEFIDSWQKTYLPLRNRTILVERYLPNTSDYRFVCFREHEPAVLARHDPCIIGDGKQTIAQLVIAENQLRGKNKRIMPLLLDDEHATRVLTHQQLTRESTPNDNQVVKLSYGADVNRGAVYEVIDNSRIHPDYWALVKTIWDVYPRMPYFSVDLLADNINLAPTAARVAINEAHVGASVHLFLDPIIGHGVNLYAHFADLLFPETSTRIGTG